jgi:hypothetical protein
VIAVPASLDGFRSSRQPSWLDVGLASGKLEAAGTCSPFSLASAACWVNKRARPRALQDLAGRAGEERTKQRLALYVDEVVGKPGGGGQNPSRSFLNKVPAWLHQLVGLGACGR